MLKRAHIITITIMLCTKLTFASGYELAIYPEMQEVGTQYCWAVATYMILHWYNQPTTIEQIIKYGTNSVDVYNTTCESEPQKNCMKQILLHFGSISSYCNYEKLNLNGSKTSIKSEIDENRPIIAHWTYKEYVEAGHFVLITGYDDEKNKIFFNDPQIGGCKWNYNMFCENSRTIWDGNQILTTKHVTSYSNTPIEYNEKSIFIAQSTKSSNSMYGGGIPTQECSAIPFTATEMCGLLQLVNVHNTNNTLWFGNTEDSWVKFPLNFEKKGKYRLYLTCRGSVYKTTQYRLDAPTCTMNPNASYNSTQFGATIKDISTFATITIEGEESNKIIGKNRITGEDLDRPYCNNYDDEYPCQCRVYTRSTTGDVGEIDVVFEIEIRKIGAYNIKIEMDKPGIINAITGLSIHNIALNWDGVLCGCMDPSAENYDEDAIDHCGVCKYPPKPTPPPPIPPHNYSFTGSGEHWKGDCNRLVGTRYTCTDRLIGFTINWGDGSTETYGQTSNADYSCYPEIVINEKYIGKSFYHHYKKTGLYKPYVKLTYIEHNFVEKWAHASNYFLPQFKVVNIGPILEFLLD